MILTCPNCATRYEADAAKFQPSGRKVRCAKCAHSWHQPAPIVAPEHKQEHEQEREDVAAPTPPPVPVESAPAPVQGAAPSVLPAGPTGLPPPPAAVAALNRWRIGALAGWGVLFAVVALVGFVLIEARTEIAALWPKTATAYRAVGLDVNTVGLEFREVSYRVTTEDDQPVLHLKGRIHNFTKQELAVPQIHAALTDDARRELYDWKIDPMVRNLKPGASTIFSARLASPPAGARHVDLKFVKG